MTLRADPSAYPCECEHAAHVDRNRRTPAGNPGHRYGAPFFNLKRVRTVFGHFDVCEDCARDCLSEQIIREDS